MHIFVPLAKIRDLLIYASYNHKYASYNRGSTTARIANLSIQSSAEVKAKVDTCRDTHMPRYPLARIITVHLPFLFQLTHASIHWKKVKQWKTTPIE